MRSVAAPLCGKLGFILRAKEGRAAVLITTSLPPEGVGVLLLDVHGALSITILVCCAGVVGTHQCVATLLKATS